MRKFKTSIEGDEYLRLVFNSDNTPEMFKLLDFIKDFQIQDLTNYNLSGGTDRELVLKKAQIDGALRLIRDLKSYAKSLQSQ